MPPDYNVARRPQVGIELAKLLANRRLPCAATFSTLYSGGRGARAPHQKISHSQLRKVFSLNIVEAQYVTILNLQICKSANLQIYPRQVFKGPRPPLQNYILQI